MPELPEVETIKNELSPLVIGHRIAEVTLLWERMVKQPSVEDFRLGLVGQKIMKITRRGKYLILKLSGGDSLIIHLKMSGSLLVAKASTEPPKYTRAIINLDNDTSIFFRDPRKFGAMWLVEKPDTIVGKLGPEPFESGFTPEFLAQHLAGRSAPIKALLCDQNFIAGVGNMYADEALFAAKIHPLRSGASLTQEEIKRLYSAIRSVLRSGIKNKGASIVNYYRPDGKLGTAHSEFKVAHQGGKPCPNCGTSIQRIAVRNRGTYFCPKCQRL